MAAAHLIVDMIGAPAVSVGKPERCLPLFHPFLRLLRLRVSHVREISVSPHERRLSRAWMSVIFDRAGAHQVHHGIEYAGGCKLGHAISLAIARDAEHD